MPNFLKIYGIHQTYTLPRPFALCKIAGNISVCAGCQNKYSKQPTPPNDQCIRHQDWREYMPTGSQTPQSRFGNVYNHFNPHCVWMRCPGFDPTLLEIPPDRRDYRKTFESLYLEIQYSGLVMLTRSTRVTCSN